VGDRVGSKSSLFGLGVLGVAVVSTIAVGSYAKRRQAAEAKADDTPPPYDQPITAEVLQSGSSAENLSNVAFDPGMGPGLNGSPAWWAKVRLTPLDGKRLDRHNLRLILRDETGRPWQSKLGWSKSDLYVVLPNGYLRRPRELELTILRKDVPVTKPITVKPTMAESTRRAPTWTANAWPGLRVSYNPLGRGCLFVTSPLSPGNVLTGEVLGSDCADPMDEAHETVVGQAISGQTMPWPLSGWSIPYLTEANRIFLRTREYRPVHFQEEFDLKRLAHRPRFGNAWFFGKVGEIPLKSGARIELFGLDTPRRLPPHSSRKGLQVKLSGHTLLQSFSARLVSITHSASLPIVLGGTDVVPIAPVTAYAKGIEGDSTGGALVFGAAKGDGEMPDSPENVTLRVSGTYFVPVRESIAEARVRT